MNPIGLDIGIAMLSVVDSNGFLGIQPDAFGEAASGMAPCETHHPLGLIARPLDPVVDDSGAPDPTQACQLLRMEEEGKSHALLFEDPRAVANLPPIQKGEVILYNCFQAFVRLDQSSAITIFTTSDGTPNGESVYQQTATNGFKQVAPWGTSTFDSNGWHVQTKGGASLTLTSVGGGGPPLDQLLSSVAHISAQMIVLDGAVSLGPSDPLNPQVPLVLEPKLQAYLKLVNQLLQDIVKVLNLVVLTPQANGAVFYQGTPGLPLTQAVDQMNQDLLPATATPTIRSQMMSN